MRLLVSVVSAPEARAAIAGGADIIDVKDPREGALGAPAPSVLGEVVAAVAGRAPVSVALGDLPDLPHLAALAAHGAAALGADFVKVGLRGPREPERAAEVMRAVAGAVGPGVGVIAATYADAQALRPPALAPRDLPRLVADTGIAGALVDTFVKDGRGLYGWLSADAIRELAQRTRAAGAVFAAAGQLTRDELAGVPADIVGVRSAVCRGGDRRGALDRELVAAAVAALRGQSIRVPRDSGERTVTTTPVRRTASGR
ncbi:MAG: hypothetical protein JOZ07_01640 [Solirubrobacterales bacterium]|nr:hypothetical protein [Solirubrobacterales bacterium]